MRVHRYTMSKQSGPGCTGTLWVNSQAPPYAVHRVGSTPKRSPAEGLPHPTQF